MLSLLAVQLSSARTSALRACLRTLLLQLRVQPRVVLSAGKQQTSMINSVLDGPLPCWVISPASGSQRTIISLQEHYNF
jgi:hypothetical protein